MQLLGLFSIAISWVAGGYIVYRWPAGTMKTLSKHAAANRSASILFAVVLAGGGALFYYFMVQWFIPTFGLGQLFFQLITLAFIAQCVTGIFPDQAGWQSVVHTAGAYTLAVLFIPLTALIIDCPAISTEARIVASLCMLYMFATFVAVVIGGRAKDRYLIFQSLYIVAFQVVILAATFLR